MERRSIRGLFVLLTSAKTCFVPWNNPAREAGIRWALCGGRNRGTERGDMPQSQTTSAWLVIGQGWAADLVSRPQTVFPCTESPPPCADYTNLTWSQCLPLFSGTFPVSLQIRVCVLRWRTYSLQGMMLCVQIIIACPHPSVTWHAQNVQVF